MHLTLLIVLMREANKPVLDDTIWKIVSPGTSSLPVSIKYVLDGGSLLQRLTWSKDKTFQHICEKYVDYVVSKYGIGAITVFDGYPIRPTTKETTHLTRSKNKCGTDTLNEWWWWWWWRSKNKCGTDTLNEWWWWCWRWVKLSLSMKVSMDKEKFLANKQNKRGFLWFLVSYMNSANLYTKQSFSDADVLIAKTAIDNSLTRMLLLLEKTQIC